MKKTYILLLIIVFLQNCSNDAEIINSNNVEKLVISSENTVEKLSGNEKQILDRDSVSSILKQLNRCAKEPIKFYPTDRIKVVYGEGPEEIILLNGNTMKYKDHTYRLAKSIRSIIK